MARVLLVVLLLLVSTATVSAQSAGTQITTVAAFAPPNLPEGVAVDAAGNVYASMAPTGEVKKIAADGTQSTFATFNKGEGFLLGVTVDAQNNVYAAVGSNNAAGTDAHGVWKIAPNGAKTLFGALPVGGLPNDILVARDGALLVSDSFMGAVHRIGTDGKVSLWVQHALLKGDNKAGCQPDLLGLPIGANGLAVAPSGDLMVANTVNGTIVRVPINADGSAGTPTLAHADCGALYGADGLVYDARGNLYVAVNVRNTIVRISASGAVQTVASAADGLDFPASLDLGAGRYAGQLIVTNFAFLTFSMKGTPKAAVLALRVADAPTVAPTQLPRTGGIALEALFGLGAFLLVGGLGVARRARRGPRRGP